MCFNNILRCCLWCLPWKLPYGKGHYATGCGLTLLTDFMCIEKCLTNVSYNVFNPNTCNSFVNKI